MTEEEVAFWTGGLEIFRGGGSSRGKGAWE